jgi:hypothetical protein
MGRAPALQGGEYPTDPDTDRHDHLSRAWNDPAEDAPAKTTLLVSGRRPGRTGRLGSRAFGGSGSLGTYYISPVVDIQHAKDLHALQTKLACKALFKRNPKGVDHPELLKQLFLGEAAEKAMAAINKTKAEFQAKSLHQKVELGAPEIIRARDDSFYTSVDVQLIRVGSFKNAPITEVLRYRVKFKFLANPDLTRNGRFPTAVAAFQVEPLT